MEGKGGGREGRGVGRREGKMGEVGVEGRNKSGGRQEGRRVKRGRKEVREGKREGNCEAGGKIDAHT